MQDTSSTSKRPRLNAEWHQAHVMPRNANLQQRTDWHIDHVRECACRPMPASVLAELERRKAASS